MADTQFPFRLSTSPPEPHHNNEHPPRSRKRSLANILSFSLFSSKRKKDGPANKSDSIKMCWPFFWSSRSKSRKIDSVASAKYNPKENENINPYDKPLDPRPVPITIHDIMISTLNNNNDNDNDGDIKEEDAKWTRPSIVTLKKEALTKSDLAALGMNLMLKKVFMNDPLNIFMHNLFLAFCHRQALFFGVLSDAKRNLASLAVSEICLKDKSEHELCSKRILMGKRCRPLGDVYGDSFGRDGDSFGRELVAIPKLLPGMDEDKSAKCVVIHR